MFKLAPKKSIIYEGNEVDYTAWIVIYSQDQNEGSTLIILTLSIPMMQIEKLYNNRVLFNFLICSLRRSEDILLCVCGNQKEINPIFNIYLWKSTSFLNVSRKKMKLPPFKFNLEQDYVTKLIAFKVFPHEKKDFILVVNVLSQLFPSNCISFANFLFLNSQSRLDQIRLH